MTIAEKMTVIKENENNPKISAANLNCKSKSKCISLILQKRTIYSLSKKFGPYRDFFLFLSGPYRFRVGNFGKSRIGPYRVGPYRFRPDLIGSELEISKISNRTL